VNFLSPVARTGSVILGSYLIEAAWRIEPCRISKTALWAGNFSLIWRAGMPEAVRISLPVSATSKRSDRYELISVALFSGIGLLLSLVAVIAGVQGFW
jgi:hypothetical protein